MNKDYFNESEKRCIEKLIEFQNNTGLFTETGKTVTKYHSDATGTTTNKLGEEKKWNIELKYRFCNLTDKGISGLSESGNIYIEDTVFIESHKVADLLLDMIEGLTPLYINFLQDGHIIIFNLANLKKRPEKSSLKNIKSKGYNKFEMAKRQGLYLSDAAIYNKDFKLIKRAGEEWKKNS